MTLLTRASAPHPTEYAYRYHDEYQYVLWARADSIEALNTSHTELATLLELPEKQEKEQDIIVQSVKRWLHREQGWLFILNNADSPELLPSFLPKTIGGHLLITTRAANVSTHIASLAQPLIVEAFSDEQGALFLLHRAGLLAAGVSFDESEEQIRQLALEISHELDGLPLAINQAGAYIEATRCSLAVYQQIYQQHRTGLLKERRSADYPESVATAWEISFRKVEQQNPAAAELLRFCAFLATDAIPEEILTKGAKALGETLSAVAADPFLLNQAIEILRAYSLVGQDAESRTLSVHRLVQVVLRDSLPVETQQQWMQRAALAVNAAFPSIEFQNWSICEPLLPHMLICATWIEDASLTTLEAARLLNQAGYYLHARGRYTEAEPMYRRALAIQEQRLGATHHDTAVNLNNLAVLYDTQGKYSEAESLYRRALSTFEQQLEIDPLDMASSLNNLSRLSWNQGKFAEAEPLLRRALTIREQQLGVDHPSTAQSLNNLAMFYQTQGKFTEAEPLLRRTLTIREQQLGVDHPSTATSLNNLALLYKKQRKYEQAELLYRRALAIREKQLGVDHPDTAESLNNLAVLYEAQRKYAEAEPLYKRALAIVEQQLGANHPDTATCLNNLAGLYFTQGKYTKADPLFQRALTIREQIFGPEHPDTAHSISWLADAAQQQGHYAEAKSLYERALATFEQTLGKSHPYTQRMRKHYANLLKALFDQLVTDEHAETQEEEANE